MVSCISETGFTFQTTPSFEGKSSNNTTIRSSQDIQGGSKRWNSSLEAIGGPKCLDSLVNTARRATCVFEQKYSIVFPSENFIHCLYPKKGGK